MRPTLPESLISEIAGKLDARATAAHLRPRSTGRGQPLHTVYGGAHLFTAGTASKLGAHALHVLDEYAPDYVSFAHAVGLPDADRLPDLPERLAGMRAHLEGELAQARPGDSPAAMAYAIYDRVRRKLAREPVEDFRIDFEDGYGERGDAQEDAHAQAAARETANGLAGNTLPAFFGIRIKAFSGPVRLRAIRTLDLYLTTLAGESGGRLPAHFAVTLPKVAGPDEVAALARLLDALEGALGFPARAISIEAMVEVPGLIMGRDGRSALPGIMEAADGRLRGAHFGAFDYLAALGVTVAHQHLLHPLCDHARHSMQTAFWGTGVWLSDSVTNVLPVGPHRPGRGAPLTAQQAEENRQAVSRAWRLHARHIEHALSSGVYQGWDVHPAQLPVRYAAAYAFFLRGLDSAAARLRAFVERAAQATLAGGVFDDEASGQGLLNLFLRGVGCGALTEAEAVEATGLSVADFETRSFARIVGRRSG